MAQLLIYTNQYDKLIGAIEYANLKYGDQRWYPGLLQRSVTRYLMIDGSPNIDNPPLQFLKSGPDKCTLYSGSSHFVIREIEDYVGVVRNAIRYKYIAAMCLFLLMTALLYFTSDSWQPGEGGVNSAFPPRNPYKLGKS